MNTPQPDVAAQVAAHLEAMKPNGMRVLLVNEHEFRLIVSGLRRVQTKIRQEEERDRRNGFTPSAGALNTHELRRATLVKLMQRLGM